MNILATTALSVGAIALSASPSTDGMPQEVTIDIHVERGCPAPDSRTFSASGAITDEGVVVTESIKAFALPASVVETAEYVRTFVGEVGRATRYLWRVGGRFLDPKAVPGAELRHERWGDRNGCR